MLKIVLLDLRAKIIEGVLTELIRLNKHFVCRSCEQKLYLKTILDISKRAQIFAVPDII